jgi:hypothetical protein
MPVYSLVVVARAKTVMVAAGAATVDVLADVAVVDGAVPFQATSNQKPCCCCLPCPAATSRQTFRCRAAKAQ